MTVIILAAGESARMGENKLLLPLKGKPLILSTIETALAYTDSVNVVIGHDKERMESAINTLPVKIIYNPDYLKGQKESTLVGVESTDDDFMIVPGDLPLLTYDDFDGVGRLLDTHEIARAIYRGMPGHPVAFRKTHKANLLAFSGTLKEYLSLYDTATYNGSIGCVLDADTPSRYNAIVSGNYEDIIL